MNKTVIGFLILIGLIASAAAGIYLMSPSPDPLRQLYTAAMEDPAKIPELLAFLDQEIERSPTALSPRFTRAAVYADLGRNAEALNDIDILVSQNPDNLNIAFVRCTLRERIGGPPRAEHLACYREVTARFADTPESPKAQNPDYIITALMAELPEAEDLRRAFLSGLGDSPADKHAREIFEQFKPENLTHPRRP